MEVNYWFKAISMDETEVAKPSQYSITPTSLTEGKKY
jgi:hypothetical protein